MIDLDGLEFEIKCVPDNECALFTKDEAFELIIRLRQAERDAARYRWLRNEASMTDMQDFSFSLTSERDAFMDDAMQCSGDNK